MNGRCVVVGAIVVDTTVVGVTVVVALNAGFVVDGEFVAGAMVVETTSAGAIVVDASLVDSGGVVVLAGTATGADDVDVA